MSFRFCILAEKLDHRKIFSAEKIFFIGKISFISKAINVKMENSLSGSRTETLQKPIELYFLHFMGLFGVLFQMTGLLLTIDPRTHLNPENMGFWGVGPEIEVALGSRG